MIASYARYGLIGATMSGTTGDHPQRAARLPPGNRPAFRPAAGPPSARRCAAMIASYARYGLIGAMMSGTTGDHPKQAHHKRPPQQRVS
jgi:hypothetical protein